MILFMFLGVAIAATVQTIQVYEQGFALLNSITGSPSESERILKTCPINWLWPNLPKRFKDAALKAMRQ